MRTVGGSRVRLVKLLHVTPFLTVPSAGSVYKYMTIFRRLNITEADSKYYLNKDELCLNTLLNIFLLRVTQKVKNIR